jgi:hypothetical protein
MLAVRNAALTAWMRRPVPVASAHTAALWQAGAGSRTLAEFAARLPGALARRRTPDPVVEAALARLAAAEREAGYRTACAQHPAAPSSELSRAPLAVHRDVVEPA